MKTIKIDRLRLENFKCHKDLEMVFSGQDVAIYGDNASGKTSVYDALTWLLFDKSSRGEGDKAFEVKPLDSAGAVADHQVITSVEAVLLVDGEQVVLKRSLWEKWTTKRGSSAETFDGNESGYWVDGVPVKKNGFDSKVRELCPEDTFHMLTSVSAFAQDLHWQKRRGVLFDISGTMSDREIMAADSRFDPLSQALGKLPLEDLKRKLAADKKDLSGIKTNTPARIDECQRTIDRLKGVDFEAIRANAEALEAEKNAMEQSANTSGTAERQRMSAELSRLSQKITADKGQLERAEKALEKADSDIQASRARWATVKREAFTGGICQTCGQVLPAEKLEAARKAFEAHKAERLHEIERTAAGQKEAQAQAAARITQLKTDIQEGETRAEELRRTLAAMGDNSEEIQREARLSELRRKISEAWASYGQRSMPEQAERRIEELREQVREAAAKLESVESLLFLIEDFTRHKAKFVEDSVNGQFRFVNFRLFREQANGGLEERCDVTVDGVPWMNLNTGARINAGIDIINTLSRHYGVSVPLFIDNAEAVTHLEHVDTQAIRLVVSEFDKELRCAYEG